jgi:hypothetical protein
MVGNEDLLIIFVVFETWKNSALVLWALMGL